MFDHVANYRNEMYVDMFNNAHNRTRAIVYNIDDAYALIDANNASRYVIRVGTKIVASKY